MIFDTPPTAADVDRSARSGSDSVYSSASFKPMGYPQVLDVGGLHS
jgi:hypothetical protein